MSTYLTAQDPVISYDQVAPISLTGITQAAIMHRFIATDGVAAPDIICESNGFSGYRLTSGSAGILSGRWRTSTINSGVSIATGVQAGDMIEIYTLVTLDGNVDFYVNGVFVDSTLAGPAWATSTFQLMLSGSVDRDYEHEELAYWIGSVPDVADVLAQVDPLLHNVPPTGYLELDGPNATHADPLVNTLEANNLGQQTGAIVAPNWPYYVGAAQSIVNVDGDNTVQDGQGSATVEVAGFASDITIVTVTDGTFVSENLISGGTGTSFTWLMSDIANLVDDTAVGQPNWMGGNLELTVSDGVDSASLAFTWSPATEWDSIALVGNTTEQGSISEGRGTPYDDGDTAYFPTHGDLPENGGTLVDIAGLIYTSQTVNFNLQVWTASGVIEVVTIVVEDEAPITSGAHVCGQGLALSLGFDAAVGGFGGVSGVQATLTFTAEFDNEFT